MRKSILTLLRKKIAFIRRDPKQLDYVQFLDARGKPFLLVRLDDLFDGEGNYFDTEALPWIEAK